MIEVTVILLNDNYASTAIGPIEVFHSAGYLWQALKGETARPRFRVTIASLDGEPVTSPYPMQIAPQVSIRSVKKADLIVVPSSGLDLEKQFARHAALFPWLRKKAAQGAHIAGTCTGAAYLAEAGLLDGHEATTHWASADEFRRRYPEVNWRPEKLITEDRRMLCSGGVYSSRASTWSKSSAAARSRCNAPRPCSSTCRAPVSRATPCCRWRDRMTTTRSGRPRPTWRRTMRTMSQSSG
jgi:transcriptional regulator GlxA family with amidase domain